MYDVQKHVNPHDIAGQTGIVKAQSIELEKNNEKNIIITIIICFFLIKRI